MRLALLLLGACACTALVEPDRSRLNLAPRCDDDDECDNGVFCDGAEECIGRICVNGVEPCDDDVQCTVDRCEEGTHACVPEPNDARCPQDPVRQRCDQDAGGCVPIPE